MTKLNIKMYGRSLYVYTLNKLLLLLLLLSLQVKAILQRFLRTTSLKVNLPPMELEAAQEDMEDFLHSHLREISSQTKSRELIEELSQKLSAHASRVWKLVQVPELGELEVSQRVIVGLAMDQPLKANFFPGILDTSRCN